MRRLFDEFFNLFLEPHSDSCCGGAGVTIGGIDGGPKSDVDDKPKERRDNSIYAENLEGKGYRPTSPNQMQKQVERGQAPSTVVRVDNPKISWQLPHIHFTDGTAMNIDGSIHDAMSGIHTLTNRERFWLFDNGWGG